MGIEHWIDEICRAAGEVADGRGSQVRSYLVYERAEFPAAMTVYPCAITYATQVICRAGDSGPLVDLWEGQTEFHLWPNTDKSHYPELMLFYGRIRNAFALHRKLGGKVAWFALKTDEASLQAAKLVYGDEVEHLGIVAKWQVKELVSYELGN